MKIKKLISAIKKRIFATKLIAMATPLKPNMAVIIATVKNSNAHNIIMAMTPVILVQNSRQDMMRTIALV